MSRSPEPRRRLRRWRRALLWLALLLALCAAAMHAAVLRAAAPFVVAPGQAPVVDFVVVPGARIHADGRPYDLLADRLTMALWLWQRGVAPRLLVSGRGGGGLAVDEVAAMRRWLEARGVPPAAIVDDGEGLRTIDTMRRCRDVHGAHTAVVVSNPFHVARAVYQGRAFGLHAYGVEAPYGCEYGAWTLLRNHGREVLARIWAFADVEVRRALAQ